jgi:probable F420-dependent oxidoreductase
MTRKFRFGIQISSPAPGLDWAGTAKKIEDLGYSTLIMPDHFNDQLAPVPAMMAAADATSTLRVGALVLDNDYRHPLVLAKELATIDVISGGRLEIGLGAGWMKTDYAASGIPYDRPGVRIERFHEGLQIIKGLMSEGPYSLAGKHYTITEHEGTPKPVQKPHPPILVGGGGRKVLSIAAQEANIIGFNFSLAEGEVNPTVAMTGTAEETHKRIGYVKDAAGGGFDNLELNAQVFINMVTDDAAGMAERVSGGFGLPAEEVMKSPHVLIGSTEAIEDTLIRRREEFGFSYVSFSSDVIDNMAPIVKRLAGT